MKKQHRIDVAQDAVGDEGQVGDDARHAQIEHRLHREGS